MEEKQKIGGYATFLKRACVFVFAMLLGMAVLVSAVAGTLYAAVTWVSLDRLEELGVEVGDEVITGESILREMSLLELFTEAMSIPSRLSELSVNKMMEEYGIRLPGGVLGLMPNTVLELPLSEMSGDRVFTLFLEGTTLETVFDLMGGGLIPEAAAEKLNPRTLDLAYRMELSALFEGVYLGDLTGVKVEKDIEGVVNPVLEPGEEPTLMSYLATMDIGGYFAAENKDAFVQKTLDRVPMDVLLESDGENLLLNALGDKVLGDLLKMEAGGFYFDADVITEDLYLGDILGYELGEDGIWYRDEKPASGMYRELVGLTVDGLTGNGLMDAIDRIYVGEIMEYEREEGPLDAENKPTYIFYKLDSEGNRIAPEGVVGELVGLTIGELRNEDTLDSEIRDITIGVAFGYTKGEDGKWRDEENQEASGVLRPMMDSTIKNFDTTLDSLYLGEIMGFDNRAEEGEDPVFAKDSDGDGVYETSPSPLMSAFVSLKLQDVDDEEKLNGCVKELRLGDALGYTQKGDEWYDGDTLVTGLYATLAPYKVDEINEAVKTVTVADALGYTKVGDDWVETDNPEKKASGFMKLLMTSTLSNLSDTASDITVGEMLGYTKTETEGQLSFSKVEDGKTVVPQGVVASFVELTLQDLEREGTITEKINGMTVGVAMGYQKVGSAWYKTYSDDDNDENDVKVENSLILSFIDKEIGAMGSTMDTLTLGDAMGYTKNDDGEWLDDSGNPETNSMLLTLLGRKIVDLSTAMDELMIGEVMGHTFVPNEGANPSAADYYKNGGQWYSEYYGKDDENNKLSSGFVTIIGPDTKVSGLNRRMNEVNETLSVGQLMKAGIVSFTKEVIDAINTRFLGINGWQNDGWQAKPIGKFINGLIVLPEPDPAT